ncbi:MAG: methyltransferase domain-containing protein [Desulfofustis sp.]|nr:methyltransferase domain-containing protein [Desulfofustis sp.]
MNEGRESGYENEPTETFTPLPLDRYCAFYHLEMNGVEDRNFYRDQLRHHGCRSVLELGCGTGRICDCLQHCGFSTIGIDNCRPMLAFTGVSRRAPTIEMDMCRLGLRRRFDAVIIAWNTLNLLGRQSRISACLRETATVLQPGGLLLLHLFVPDQQLRDHPGQRFFQYRLLDLPSGGKLVKETQRTYHRQSRLLHLEERYKLRLLPGGAPNCNFSHNHQLAALPAETWQQLLEQSGYMVTAQYGDFAGLPYRPGEHSTLLVTARLIS